MCRALDACKLTDIQPCIHIYARHTMRMRAWVHGSQQEPKVHHSAAKTIAWENLWAAVPGAWRWCLSLRQQRLTMYGRITPQLLFAPVGNSGLMSFASLASTDAALGRLRLQLKLRLFCFLVSTRLEQGAQLSSLVVNELNAIVTG